MPSLTQQLAPFPSLQSIKLAPRKGLVGLVPGDCSLQAGKTPASQDLAFALRSEIGVATGRRNLNRLHNAFEDTIEPSSFWSRLRFRLFKARKADPVSGARAESGAAYSQKQQDQALSYSTGQSNMASKSTYYLSHGSPMLPLEDSTARDFFRDFPKTLPDKPKAILMISGHWDTREPMVSTTAKNETIYDFYGFPPELYRLSYTPPGAPAVGQRVKRLLQDAGFNVGEDKKRGVDHGAWVPLLLMYPQADIPVLQLSVQSHRNAAYHYKLGQALQPLKDEGVMIIGSGSAVHNLREVMMSFSSAASPTIQPWAKSFDDFIRDSLLNKRFEDVIHYESRAPNAKRAHPSNDHFVPLLVALGAAGENVKAELIHSSWQGNVLSYASYAFRPQ